MGFAVSKESLESWEALRKKILSLNIFDPSSYSDSFLKRRVEARLRAVDLDSYAGYSEFLDKDVGERDELFKALTIKVTHFFRDASAYEVMRQKVIPEVIKNKEAKNEFSISVWSAGCSTGEEAYGIAILLKEVLGVRLGKFRISIMATDLDEESIAQAKQGSYLQVQFRETSDSFIQKYFNKDDFGSLNIKDEIKKMVMFKVGDILSRIKPKDIDLIICRNTVIYFSNEVKEVLYLDFFNCLNPGGFLMLGKTEILRGRATAVFKNFDHMERIYQKPF